MPEGQAEATVVRHQVEVGVSPGAAFDAFTSGIAGWWPREFTWSRDTLERIGIEPEQGGACFELGPHGFRCDWGRVLSWDPPHGLVLSWQISPERAPEPDPGKASEVSVHFEAAGEGTRVVVEHRDFRRHGGEFEAYRAGMDRGWFYLFGCYARAVRRSRADGEPG